MKRRLFALSVLVGLMGCAKDSTGPTPVQTTVQSKSESADPWTLSLSDPKNTTPALLWNGLIGVRLSRSGGGLGVDGKPLDFFMIDEYEQKGEEKILPLPNPILVTWSIGNSIFEGDRSKTHDYIKSGGTPLDPSGDISDYSQSLDMRAGKLTTSWIQQTKDGGKVSYKCETVIHPTQRNIGQLWTIKTETPTTFSVKSLDYSGPNDQQEPLGADDLQTVGISSSKSRIVVVSTKVSGGEPGATSTVGGFRIQEGKIPANTPVTYERTISFGPHSPTPLPEFGAKNADAAKKIAPQPLSYQQIADAAAKAWADRWKTDIIIDGPAEDQRAIHSFLFYLRSGIAPEQNASISPFALSNRLYNGHVFWDADVWVFPALALLDPDAAKSIAKYRLAKEPAAEGNFRAWFKAKDPTILQPAIGVKFPWESSVSGAETVLGPSRLEDHITGDVLWQLTQSEALGFVPAKVTDRIAALAANFYYSRGTMHPGGKYSIENVMSPDENHTGNNDLYTNLLASWLTSGRRWSGPAQSLPFAIPHDSKGLISYDDDKFRGYKQAAAVLSIYPLQFPDAERDSPAMMARFEPNIIPNGPAMTDSVNSVVWSRAGDPKRAYEDWRKSWQPFTQFPFLLFSEKRNQERTYFTTGAGGSLQAVLYGFLGFRIDLNSQPKAGWSKPLLTGRMLSIKPNLPAEWKSIKLTNFSVLNKRYTVSATHDAVQVTQGE